MGKAKQYQYQGEYKTLRELEDITNISARTIRKRLNLGWTIERATSFKQQKLPRKTRVFVKMGPGDKNNRLTIIKKVKHEKGGFAWECACDCGNRAIVRNHSIANGQIRSCGCLWLEKMGEKATHGLSGTREYKIWAGMKSRCYGPKNSAYKKYGGVGIKVCDRWLNSFQNFIDDMGKSPTNKHSLDRKENHKGYDKDNCRWATTKEQCVNRRSTKLLTYNGESLSMSEWGRRLGLGSGAIALRLSAGWTLDKTLSTPKRMKCN